MACGVFGYCRIRNFRPSPRDGSEPERAASPASQATPAANDAGGSGGRTAGSTPATGANHRLIAHALCDGFDASEDGTGRGTPLLTPEEDALDSLQSYNVAVQEIGLRVKAGGAVPHFMLSRKANGTAE
jgi:hypothetical protein